jgi:hypothetical protein
MGEIRRRNVFIALYIPPEFRNLTLEQQLRNGNFRFPIGEAFATKLVKALSYNFDRIRIMKTSDDLGSQRPDAVMRIELQDADLNVAATPGFATVDASSYLRHVLRLGYLTDKIRHRVFPQQSCRAIGSEPGLDRRPVILEEALPLALLLQERTVRRRGQRRARRIQLQFNSERNLPNSILVTELFIPVILRPASFTFHWAVTRGCESSS